MAVLWVILILASTGLQLAQGLPVNPTPRDYPHEASGPVFEAWSGGAVVPALAVVLTAIGVLFGCTWCYRHKDCKPNEGADNQLFTASVTHLHEGRRSQPPDSGFSEPVNNNISEDNNNGPISLREMQNIANNNAAVYITSENEERNRISRESVVEFEPLPSDIRVIDPLERCADWFAGEDFPREQLQYLREINRGWFGRVVEGEIDDGGSTSTVAVRILNQNASLEDKARFLDEGRLYRDMSHENVLGFVAKCLQEDPWILIFELCSMDLQQYLTVNRPKMAILNESGVPLQLMCDVTSALAYIHSRGYLYGNLWSGNILVRGTDNVRAVVGQYCTSEPPAQCAPPETDRQPSIYNSGSEVWSLGWVVWSVCSWGSAPPPPPAPAPDLPCPYRNHLYQVMQLCWNQNPESRPSAAQVHALINHLHYTHSHANDSAKDDGYSSSDFEERWQKLKPNTIPKIDEHVAIVHAPSTSMVSHFTGSDQEFDNAPTIQDSLSVELDTAVSRSSSIMSDRDPLSIQIKSDSLTNLHGSLEDVRNIYLTHNETATLECHQGNIQLEDGTEREDRSDSSMDPWVKDIINGSQDDVSYYKDVSDVIKNLDNILNSEKTSSSESSHQASPSRDNLSLECKKDYPMQTSMVKSPGISNFQNILDMGFDSKSEDTDRGEEDEGDGDTIGTLSHSFERHSDTISQQTLENLTPETPVKDLKTSSITNLSDIENLCSINDNNSKPYEKDSDSLNEDNVASNSVVPKLIELCVASMPSVSETNEKVILKQDCQTNKHTLDNKTTNSNSKETAIDVNIAFINNEITSEIRDKNEITTEMKITNEKETRGEKVITNEIETKNENEITTEIETRVENVITNEIETKNENEITTEIETRAENEIVMRNENEISTEMKITNEIETKNENEITAEMQIRNEINSIDEEFKYLYENDLIPDVNGLLDIESEELNEFSDDFSTKIHNNEVLSVLKEPMNNTLNYNEEFGINNCVKLVSEDTENNSTEKDKCLNNTQLLEQIANTEQPETVQNSNNPENYVVNDATFNVSQKNLELSEKVEISTKIIDFKSSETLATKPDISEGIEESKNLKISPKIDVSTNLKMSPEIEKDESKNLEISPETEIDESTNLEISPETEIDEFTNLKISPETEIDESTNLKISSEIKTNESTNLKISTETEIDESTNLKISPEIEPTQPSDTVYMDLMNDTSSEILKDESLDNNVKNVIKSCLEGSDAEINWSIVKNDSTVYLDLPSIKDTHDFLQSEKIFSSKNVGISNICTSTPKGSDASTESTLEPEQNTEIISVTKVPDYPLGVTLTKLEQRYVPENLSPFDSPSKSHHTDTYDENSSVVLGPFENCTLDLYKGLKSSDLTDLHKEELLALSSNFSEMNLETPSPLRDSNFLNEVPDIVADEFHFDDIATMSEAKPESLTANTETEDQSSTEKRISPLTPPNSPGNFLASTSHQKYLVDIDDSDLPNNVDVNQIELQITTKLAMAENENNMNLEYSGPLSEEGLTFNETILIGDDAIPESYLAGNKSAVENLRDSLAIDEERMKELRNELELKLPLAQVAGIEPAVEGEWSELPPPPELVLTYGALSTIAEETGLQLCAYENDDQWNASTHTDSSASYPEPCNISDEVTDLPTAQHSTYTITKDNNHTYTVQKEVPSSKEITMSADSLNASPLKNLEEIQSPIDDKTYNKNEDDDKDANCERLSQVSPFLLSPTTDTSVPESDNAACVSTLSKPTVPTDAKSSKPSETQCLSKATSIDSWCSNDTLYNVEENFDDLAMDSDIPVGVGEIENDKSESDDTLTHNDDDKELSHCSTYIIHDSKSEICETFTPDSITANDNYTYTKVKSEVAGTTPSVITKSDLNDSTKNTTKDLAYGTLMSGLPTYSHCTTELASGIDDSWKFQQPELVRRSPIGDEDKFTPPKNIVNQKLCENENVSPQLTSEPRFRKMESVEITCLIDTSADATKCDSSEGQSLNEENDNEKSPNIHFKNMAHSVTSTPFTVIVEDTDNVESIPIRLPDTEAENSEYAVNSLTNFQSFFQSAEIRPQDISSNVGKEVSSEILLEGESKSISNKDITDKTPGYSDSENSENVTPQEPHFRKMEIVEIACLKDTSADTTLADTTKCDSSQGQSLNEENDNEKSPNIHFKNMAHSVTSTPFTVIVEDTDNVESIPIRLPDTEAENSEYAVNSLTNFQSFFQSAEIRPQDISSNVGKEVSSEILLEGESKSISNKDITDKTPGYSDSENSENVTPQEPHFRKMEIVEIACLKDTSADTTLADTTKCDSSQGQSLNEENDNEKSPNIHFKNMAHSVTSTPFTVIVEDTDNVESIPIRLPDTEAENSEYAVNSLTNFQSFFQSAEIRPQDISSNVGKEVSSEILLEGESKSISNKDITDKTPGYSDSENSENVTPQEPHFRKMEIVEIACLKDTSADTTLADTTKCDSSQGQSLNEENDNEKSPNIHFRNMAHSVTSTPFTVIVEDTDNVEFIPIRLPDTEAENSEYAVNSLTNFQSFFQSAEIRPQDISSNVGKEVSSEILLEGESKSISNKDITDKTPGYSDSENSENVTPQEPHFRKMEIVEIACLKDTSADTTLADTTKCDSSQGQSLNEENDNEKSPNIHFRNMAHSVTSTPFTVIVEDTDNVEFIPIRLPDTEAENSEYAVNSLTNFQSFFQSAEIRPQDISSNVSKEVSSEILLEGESKSISNNDITDKTPGYSDFENSANAKPQDSVQSGENSSQKNDGVQDEFQQFESSVKSRPQDLSSVIDASSLLLKSERRSTEIAMGSITSAEIDTSNSEKQSSEIESYTQISTNMSNLLESHTLPNRLMDVFITDLDMEEETEQPHSIIITESPLLASKVSPNRTFDSHAKSNRKDMNFSYDSHGGGYQPVKNIWINESFEPNERVNGLIEVRSIENEPISDIQFSSISMYSEPSAKESQHESDLERNVQGNTPINDLDQNSPIIDSIKCNGGNEMYATVNFLNETFEELLESNVDDNDFGNNDYKDEQTISCEKSTEIVTDSESIRSNNELTNEEPTEECIENNTNSGEDKKIVLETNSFLQNEKNFCQLDSYFPLLSDIRFTGPATEIMSTSFTQDSPTDPTSPECEQDSKPDPTAEILKEWDSDSDTHSTNSSSGEFIWKDGDGHETALVPSTLFDHQRDSASHSQPSAEDGGAEGEAGSGSGDSGSGSEGDEVEFVPSSWDCRAAPAKSSLRSLEQTPTSTLDIKKRVVFKRQKYHCVYEYPREVTDGDVDSPAAYLPDYSTYSDWDPSSVEEAELGYGQLFGGPDPLDLFPLRSGIAFGADYDEDFFISSSARPFECLGVMSTTSQFFPGMHVKPMLERELSDDIGEDFPPPPSPLPHATPPAPALAPAPPAPPANTALAITPSFDFTTPDSGVEDITPGSMAEDDFKGKKLSEPEPACWRATDSASSSESASPSSPAAEALGGLRHTRDKLKLDLPPSPHAPSPRHSRVFSFVLDKPRRPGAGGATPDDPPPPATETPREPRDDVAPEPTFSTFGKSAHCKPAANPEAEKIILTDELREEAGSEQARPAGGAPGQPGRGEGTVLDSGDEDSGIESSSKATLERNKHTPDVS